MDTDDQNHLMTVEVDIVSDHIYVNLYNASYDSEGFIISTSLIKTLDTMIASSTASKYNGYPVHKITNNKWLIATATNSWKMISIVDNDIYISNNAIYNQYVTSINFIGETSIPNKYCVIGTGNPRGYSDTGYAGAILFTISNTEITQNSSSSSYSIGAFNPSLGV
jgi:hypothetical protein